MIRGFLCVKKIKNCDRVLDLVAHYTSELRTTPKEANENLSKSISFEKENSCK